jgi:AraC-like DNA-binding protein
MCAIGVDNAIESVDGHGLSSIRPNWEGIGRKLAEVVDAVVSGEPWHPGVVHRVGGARLVRRTSLQPMLTSDKLIAKVLQYFRKGIEEGQCPAVGDAAGRFNISRRTLTTRFSAAVGMSPRDYLLKGRLQESQRLLLETDLTIAHIAQRCGFSKQSSFTYRFRSQFGQTPSAYRAHCRAGEK